MLRAGADLVSTDTGLVYTGPGLPRRISEAALYASPPPASSPAPGHGAAEAERTPERSWFWVLLMGAGMLLGSVLALVSAATRVVLPYDEQFVDMAREKLTRVNPRLLSFLAHGRVSLAGAMIATGVLYIGLALFGLRRGAHWAMVAVFSSAFVGFATFFLFLGYGYLDPFHAFVTLVLFQFLLMAIHSRLGRLPIPEPPNLRGGWRWRVSQWGQLVLIGHAAAVVVAGLVIAGLGVTVVFVPEGLEFMHATAHGLAEANARLLPLIAHDRASFGGNLVSVGLCLLLSSLWGFRPRSAWLWWTMFLAVVPAYAAAIAVHWAVGYTDLWHLTPAYGGLGLFLVGMALSYPHLCGPGASDAEWAAWRRGVS